MDQVFLAGNVLATQGIWHIFLHKNFAAAALCSQREKFRVRSVHRNAEAQSQLFLPVRRVKRNKVRPIRADDQRANLLDQSRPLQQFLTERTLRTVHRWSQEKSLPRVAGNDARKKIEVVIDDTRKNHSRR